MTIQTFPFRFGTLPDCLLRLPFFTVPDQDTLRVMQKRENELQQSKLSRRAFSLPCCDRCAAALQIQIRVVREFDMVRDCKYVITRFLNYYFKYVERTDEHYCFYLSSFSPIRQ